MVCLQLESEGVSIVLSTGPFIADIPDFRGDTPFALPIRVINAAQEILRDVQADPLGDSKVVWGLVWRFE